MQQVLDGLQSPDAIQRRLDQLATEMERFNAEAMEEAYLNDAGLKEELELTPIYRRFSHLFARPAVDEVRRLVQEAERLPDVPSHLDLQRRARLLLEFMTTGYLGQAVKELVDELGTEEAKGTVEVDGAAVPFRNLAVRIANEPDRSRRQRLQSAREAFTARLNPLRERIATTQAGLAVELGYPSYADMYRALKGIDYDALGRTMEAFLERTEAPYVETVEPLLRERAGVGFAEARRHDLAWVLRASQFDGWFPADRLLEALEATMSGLGIEMANQPNVRLDTEARPSKSPRAFCAAVRVPHDIRLVIMPHGGQDDYHALFHEAGHTQHFAHTRPDLPAEYRYLGDNSVTESFAFLLEYLVTDPLWLERRLGISPASASQYVAFSRADRLYYLRRYAGKLRYELELHRSASVRDAAPRYREILTGATHVYYDEVDYLSDVDPAFYVAEYLRAWALEVMLRETLRRRFGRLWFEERRAGDFLRELWAQGQRESGDELARRLGWAQVDFEPLVCELTEPA